MRNRDSSRPTHLVASSITTTAVAVFTSGAAGSQATLPRPLCFASGMRLKQTRQTGLVNIGSI